MLYSLMFVCLPNFYYTYVYKFHYTYYVILKVVSFQINSVCQRNSVLINVLADYCTVYIYYNHMPEAFTNL